MANTQEFITVIRLNDTEAKNNLEQLRKKVADLTAARNKAISAGSDTNFIKELSKDLKTAKAELKAYDTNVRKTIDTLNNLSTASLADVRKAMRALKKQMEETTDVEDYRRLNNLFDQCTERVNEFTSSVGKNRAEMRKMAEETKIAANALNNLNTASVSDLRLAQSSLESRMNGVNPDSDEWRSYNEQLQQVKIRLQEIADRQKIVNTIVDQYNKEMAEAGLEAKKVATNTQLIERTMGSISTASVRDLEVSLKLVNQQLENLDRGSAEFKAMQAQAKKLRTELEKVRNEGAAHQSMIGKFADWANRMQTVALGLVASITGVSMTVRKCVSDFAEMDQAMTDVQKYTGQTKEEVREMNETFKQMDTRTSREQLNALAGDAGRLGITSREMIEEFVDGADKISVALGDDLGKDAVAQIGKLADMFGASDEMGLRAAMLATGSAVNELAQSSSASAGYLVDFTARVAGVGKQAGLTQQQIMGFASVLDQNMQQDETSATAMQNLITKMFQDPAKFAKIAGQNVKEFSDLLKKDANDAILKFLESMRAKGGFAELAPMFEEMAMDGSRATGVLSVMADKLDDIRTAQNIANEAYAEGTSVINEFNTQMDSEQARLDIASKQFKELSIDLGKKLLPVARYTISTASLMVKAVAAVIDIVSKCGVTIATLTASIVALTVAQNANVIATKLQVFWHKKVLVAVGKVWAVLKAHPYAVLATAIAVATAAIIDFFRNTEELTAAQEALDNVEKQAAESISKEKMQLEQLHKIAKDTSRDIDDRQKAISEIQKIVPEYIADIDKEGDLYEQNATAIDKYIKELDKIAKAKARVSVMQDLYTKQQETELKIMQKQAEADKYNARYQQADPNNQGSLQGLYWGAKYTSAMSDLADLQKQADETADAIERLGKQMAAEDLSPDTSGIGSTGSGTGSTGMTDKEKKAAEKAAKKAAAAKKKAMNEELKAAKAANDALQAENIIAYQSGEKLYRDYIDDQSTIIIKGIDDRIAIYKKYGEEYQQLSDERAEAELKGEEAHNKALLSEIERNYQKEVALANAAYNDRNSDAFMDEAQLNERLFEAEMSALADRMAVQKEFSEEWLNTAAEMEQREAEHKIELQRYYAEKLSQYREQWGKTDIQTQAEIELKGLDDLYNKKLIKEEEYQEMRKQIEAKAALQQSQNAVDNTPRRQAQSKAATSYQTASNRATVKEEQSVSVGLGDYLVSDITHYRNTMEELKKIYGEDAENYEEYQLAKQMATETLTEGIVSKMQTAFDSISNIMSAVSSYYSAQCNYEVNETTTKYDKMIDAAEGNEEKQEQLEELKQAEIAKIKTKYNEKQMQIEVAQAYASTAMAAINAYASASKVSWILGPIAAAAATAAGLLQVAAIKKQHEAEAVGYYEGGFTGGRDYRREAGVVHEGEFVANHSAVNNASILPALQLIDRAQRNNTVGSLTAADVSRSLGAGGTTVVSAPSVTVNADNEELRATVSELSDTVSQLRKQIEGGIYARVSIDGNDGVYKNLKSYERLLNNK